jgi:autotransporter-associated beta strand protein
MKPNHLAALTILAIACGLDTAFAQIPAFPGAQGYGAYATGGRGGDVYYVTNLNNNGAGSLREGLNSAPAAGRTIMFAVSGYIPVVSDTNFNIPSKVTIAGQSAPGDGVGLRGGRMLISGSNVVMRHFRIRHGRNGTGGDCLNIASTASSTMLDHISMMFSTDENFSFFNSSVNNFTMQYSNTAWGMERHNAGGLWDLQNGSCHHTLWAHHRTRNPKARPSMLEWINNVTFHWRSEGFIMGDSQTPANWKANVRGCYYISIKDPDTNFGIKNTGLTKAQVATNGVPNFSLHLDDTLFDNNDNGLLDGTNRGYGIVSGSEFTPGDPVGANRYYKSATPFTGATGAALVTVDDPTVAYKKVVSSASPLRLDANYTGPLRDELDSLLTDSVVKQYSILVQKDSKVAGEDPTRTNNGEQLLADQYGITNNGFGTLNGTTPPTDSDLDGMPDVWEITLNGLGGMVFNVAADDHNTVFSAGQIANTFFPAGTPTGYTYLEEYLHFLAIPHATVAKNTAGAPSFQTVDLRKFTDGFSKTPGFTLAGLVNGTAQQFLADGVTPSATGPIVKFTPTLNASGRAGFNFTVTDAEGSQWTQQFALLVTAAAAPRDLLWIGDGTTNAWNNTTPNWRTRTGAAATFDVGDTALFDDRGSASPAINVAGTQTAGSVLVTGSKNYALGGSGSIASTGALTKAGSTTLTISNSVSFANGTFLNGGETVLNNGGVISGGAIKFTGGSTLRSNRGSNDGDTLTLNPAIEVAAGAVGNLTLSQRVNLKGALSGGGTFNIFSPSNLGTEGRVYLDGASAGCTGTVNLSGGATAPGNAGRISFRANGGSFNGFGSARVNLSGIDLFTTNNSGGNTYGIGQLSGDANARLRSNYVGGSTTWSVGGLNTSSTFAGGIMDGTAVTNLTKTGSGTFTLSGANSYSGATAVNNGKLFVAGSLGNTTVTLGNGATLAGNGPIAGTVNAQSGSTLAGASTISGLTTLSGGGTVSPGNLPGDRGVITAAGGFSVSGSGTLVFDLSNSPAGNNDRVYVTGGSGYLGGLTNTFQINMADGVLGAGSYHLIDCAPGIPLGIPYSTTNMVLQINAPATTRQTFGMQRSSSGAAGGSVRLNVTNSAGSLVWTGANGNTWDLNTTANFSGGPSGDNKFYNLDKIDFTDSASTGNVTLTGNLQPRELVVGNQVLNYVFNATAGAIVGSGSLVKTGGRSLTIAASAAGNSYSGGTLLYDGTLAVSGINPLGTGPITMNGGTLALPNTSAFLSNSMVFSGNSAITSGNAGNSTIVNSTAATFSSSGQANVSLAGLNGILSINGSMGGFSGSIAFGGSSGMVRLNANSSGSSDVNFGSANALFDLGTAGATLNNRNGNLTIQLGALAGGPNTKLRGRQTGSGPTATTYVIGALNTNTTFAGSIHSDGDLLGVNIVKTGSGKWTLSGNSNFVGSLDIDAGTLELAGSLACTGGADLNNTASLIMAGGTLTVDNLEIAAGATLSGNGTIAGELLNHGTITTTSGTLAITGSVANHGTMRLMRGSQLSAIGPFQNYGILDLLTAAGGLPPNLENFGVVIDSSGLEVISAGIQGTDFELRIMTYSGHIYQFEHSPTMAAGSWSPVGAPVAGNDSEKTFLHTGGVSGARRFYRVAIDP